MKVTRAGIAAARTEEALIALGKRHGRQSPQVEMWARKIMEYRKKEAWAKKILESRIRRKK